MIKRDSVVRKALCDACGKPLSSEDQHHADGTVRDVHYGELNNEFGYGSRLDGIDNALGKLVFCEDCYIKIFKALNLPPSQWETPWHLKVISSAFDEVDDKPFDQNRDDRRSAYYAPVWRCVFCNWTEYGRGYSIPDHSCPNVTKIKAARKDSCGACQGHVPDVRTDPYYSEQRDAWVHFRTPDTKGEDTLCTANPLMIQLMREGERVNPEWKARMGGDA